MRLPKRNKIDKNKNLELKMKTYKQDKFKPKGFWYSCYNSWYNWLRGEMPEWLFKYIHKINIKRNIITNIQNKDKDKLLVINNIKDFDILIEEYGFICKTMSKQYKTMSKQYKKAYRKKKYYCNWIDWRKVSKDYGGIEICPLLKDGRVYLWYSIWDVGSGCIWNIEKIIKDTELIYEKKNNKYIKI